MIYLYEHLLKVEIPIVNLLEGLFFFRSIVHFCRTVINRKVNTFLNNFAFFVNTIDKKRILK